MAKQTFTTGQVLTAAQMTSLQQTAMLGGAASAKTASYTLVAADAGGAISMSNASATTITVNTALFAAGDTVQITNLGAGVCTITAGTATVNTASSLALAQYESGTLDFTSTSAAVFIKGAGAAGASLANYALIGSAALTAASTITISGISGKNSLFIYVAAGSCTSSGQNITIQFNTDSGANYYYGGITTDNSSTGRFGQAGAASVNFIDMGNNAADVFSGYMIVEGTGSAGIKPYTYASFAGGTNAGTKVGTGYYSGTSAVSSVSVLAGANFDAGTIYVYGA
jgi:hypothetical protein